MIKQVHFNIFIALLVWLKVKYGLIKNIVLTAEH